MRIPSHRPSILGYRPLTDEPKPRTQDLYCAPPGIPIDQVDHRGLEGLLKIRRGDTYRGARWVNTAAQAYPQYAHLWANKLVELGEIKTAIEIYCHLEGWLPLAKCKALKPLHVRTAGLNSLCLIVTGKTHEHIDWSKMNGKQSPGFNSDLSRHEALLYLIMRDCFFISRTRDLLDVYILDCVFRLNAKSARKACLELQLLEPIPIGGMSHPARMARTAKAEQACDLVRHTLALLMGPAPLKEVQQFLIGTKPAAVLLADEFSF